MFKSGHSAQLTLSVIVIGYRMRKQLQNTLYTLSANYQRGVTDSQYEVIVVENHSDDELDPQVVQNLGSNFRYFHREDHSGGPVDAMNFAFQQAKGEVLCLIIDGARMVSPGLLDTALMAFEATKHAVVFAPGYHIGEQEHHTLGRDYSYADEEALMASINWRNDGYQLFNVATFSNSNRQGYLRPVMECNCLFASAETFRKVGFADTRFNLPGGGAINLHMTRQIGMLPESRLFILPGEGCFHQFHGGVTTSNNEQLEQNLKLFKEQLDSFWDGEFNGLRREPSLLGTITPEAYPFFAESLRTFNKRSQRLAANGQPLWPDDDIASGHV